MKLEQIRREAEELGWPEIPLGDTAWCVGGREAWQRVLAQCTTAGHVKWLGEALEHRRAHTFNGRRPPGHPRLTR